jgi:hypothetical protein
MGRKLRQWAYLPRAAARTERGRRKGAGGKGPVMTISADDVRALLAAAPDAMPVIVEGRAAVISAEGVNSPRYRGALQVVTRGELVDRVGDAELSVRELAELATDLDTAVSEVGG